MTQVFFSNLDEKLMKTDLEEMQEIKKSIHSFFDRKAILNFLVETINKDENISFISDRAVRQVYSAQPTFLVSVNSDKYSVISAYDHSDSSKSKILYFVENVIGNLTDEMSLELKLNNPEKSISKLLKREIHPSEVDEVEFIAAFTSAIFSIDSGEKMEDEITARLLFF
jgi:hypothetical protein